MQVIVCLIIVITALLYREHII